MRLVWHLWGFRARQKNSRNCWDFPWISRISQESSHVNHWFPLIRQAIKAIFLGKGTLGRVGWLAIMIPSPKLTASLHLKLDGCETTFILGPGLFFRGELLVSGRWWLNQPIWKICSSNWIIFPGFRCENAKYLKPPDMSCNCLVVWSKLLFGKAFLHKNPSYQWNFSNKSKRKSDRKSSIRITPDSIYHVICYAWISL